MKTSSQFLLWIRQMVAALADFDQVLQSQTVVKTRHELERMVMLATLGELNGVSLAPPYLVLCLLPYFVPKVYQWRRLRDGLIDFSDGMKGVC
jgi:hypothetical protein